MNKKFKNLPDKLIDRIAALTPISIHGFTTQIHIIDKAVKSRKPTKKSNFATTYICNNCKVTDQIKYYALQMFSTKSLINYALTTQQNSDKLLYVYDSATENGWTQADIHYDAILHGLIIPSIKSNLYNGMTCDELEYIYTNLVIVISDYYKNQHVGWYFYNKNLDSPLRYTNKI